MPAGELVKLLSSDELNVSSEEEVYQALLSWINFDLAKRTQSAAKLLGCVRYESHKQ